MVQKLLSFFLFQRNKNVNFSQNYRPILNLFYNMPKMQRIVKVILLISKFLKILREIAGVESFINV